LAIYLEGYRPSVYKRADKRYGTVMVRNPGFFYEDAGEQDVWCITTELGSFTAEQNGHIHLTGTSLPASKVGAAANLPRLRRAPGSAGG
jgi:hypothetical protein